MNGPSNNYISGCLIRPAQNLTFQLPTEDLLWFLRYAAVRVLAVEGTIRFLGSLLFLAVTLDVAGCQHPETR